MSLSKLIRGLFVGSFLYMFMVSTIASIALGPTLAMASTPQASKTLSYGIAGSTAITVPIDSITGSTGGVQLQGTFDVICALGLSATLTAGNYYPCWKDGALYKVTTGNSAHIIGVRSASSIASTLFQFTTTTVAPPAGGSSASGTSAVFEGGAAASYHHVNSATVLTWVPEGMEWNATSATYLQVQVDSNAKYSIKATIFETLP